jgi:hypothetical protein
VAGLSARLAAPLRCLWLSQAAPLWALPQREALPFTPLVCVSASAPLAGHGHRTSEADGGDCADPDASPSALAITSAASGDIARTSSKAAWKIDDTP